MEMPPGRLMRPESEEHMPGSRAAEGCGSADRKLQWRWLLDAVAARDDRNAVSVPGAQQYQGVGLLLERVHGFRRDRNQLHALHGPRSESQRIRPQSVQRRFRVLGDQPGLDETDQVHARLAG